MNDGISTGEAGRRIGVSQQYIWRLVNEGRLAATKTPLGLLVDPADLARFAAERAAKKSEAKNRKVVKR